MFSILVLHQDWKACREVNNYKRLMSPQLSVASGLGLCVGNSRRAKSVLRGSVRGTAMSVYELPWLLPSTVAELGSSDMVCVCNTSRNVLFINFCLKCPCLRA